MEPGTLIASRYTIERELGRGGMGSVFLAKDQKLGSKVAVKIGAAAGLSYDEFRERFKREARIGDRLGRADGFVRALDWGELDGSRLYLAMDLVDGAKPLDPLEGSPPERVAKVLTAARLVAAAHAKGVIHRDLKPQNFLVDASGRVFLSDFGLAKVVGEPDEADPAATPITRTGYGLGTPPFMPPEQFEDARGVDGRADVFALGVLLFVALASRYPYEGSPSAIHRRQVRVQEGLEPPPRPSDRNPPSAVEALCLRAIELDPEKRLADAATFVRALEEVLDAEAATDTVPQVRVPPPAPPSRSPIVAAVVILACVALAALLVRSMGKGERLRGTARVAEPLVARRPLGGAQVEVVGTSLRATTSSTGAFEIAGVAPGLVTLEVRHESLKAPVRKTVEFVAGEPVDVALGAQDVAGSLAVVKGRVRAGPTEPGDPPAPPGLDKDASEFVVELAGIKAEVRSRPRVVRLEAARCVPRVLAAVRGEILRVENELGKMCLAGDVAVKSGAAADLRLVADVTITVDGVAFGFVRASDDVSAVTDEAGAFTLGEAPRGKWPVRVWHPLLAKPWTGDVVVGDADLDLHLVGAKWTP